MSRKILIWCVLSVLTFVGAGISVAQQQATAAAEAGTTETNAELLLPTSYEQYLELTDPSDIAVAPNYTAIADGNLIYLYDRKANAYFEYVHDENTEASYNDVTKLQFDESGNLYFLDASTSLYCVAPESLKEGESGSRTKLSCSTFSIFGDTLYFTNVTTTTNISKVAVNAPDVQNAVTVKSRLSSKPTIAFWENELYYTDNGRNLWKLNPTVDNPETTDVSVAGFSSEIVSMTLANGLFAYTDLTGRFSVYALSELSELGSRAVPVFTQAGNFSALTADGGYLYVVEEDRIRQYCVDEMAFTEYEICSTSNSTHRLDGGSDTCLAGDLLLLADSNNQRISVLDLKTNGFLAPIPTTELTFLASDGNTALAASPTKVTLYSLESETYGQVLQTFETFEGNIVGVANVDDRYYLVTDVNAYHCLEFTQEAWRLSGVKKTSSRYAKLLASDVYGTLYVVCNDNKVYTFSESAFRSLTEKGEERADVSHATQKLLVDYEGNLYSLAGGKLYKNDSTEPLALDPVPVHTDKGELYSFTFGVEDNATYLLYDGSFVVKTTALHLPTVKNIPVQNADEIIFNAESVNVTVVKTKPYSLFVEFDVESLQGAETFPYLSFQRYAEERTALRLGESEKYDILAYFDKAQNRYFTYLVLKTSCEELGEDEYKTDYGEQTRTGYLTNNVNLYKFPYLTSLLKVDTLKRGTQITLLGEINELDYPYYLVKYVDETGAEKTGYVPQAYVSDHDGTPPQTEVHTYGKENRSLEVWRLFYLLLGTLAICVLVDCLILRKRKDDSD
ncbi:MAG: hypothetical protein IJV85_02560 [Clostridia bacterium]|nr:hypothetical protein [Clostridia bacterium]